MPFGGPEGGHAADLDFAIIRVGAKDDDAEFAVIRRGGRGGGEQERAGGQEREQWSFHTFMPLIESISKW
jgi:hypothetical protein